MVWVCEYCWVQRYSIFATLSHCPRYNTKCSGENEIRRGIFRLVSCFPLHFVLYLGNFDNFLDSVSIYSWSSWCWGWLRLASSLSRLYRRLIYTSTSRYRYSIADVFKKINIQTPEVNGLRDLFFHVCVLQCFGSVFIKPSSGSSQNLNPDPEDPWIRIRIQDIS